MEFFNLRCNSLTCRSHLKERAVVTTCSHIFCLPCADKLGLSHPTNGGRQCPACHSALTNPDDVVSTILSPTEDYKTSVLSGLDPNTIMECAGRALAFWAYQTTQEVFYQEFLGKTLTQKYTALNSQMDKVIHNANSEISTLQNRLTDMQNTQDQLHKKNQELVDLYRDKSNKFIQITNLYNLLKSRAMRSQMQTAASDSVSRTLNSLGTRNEPGTAMSDRSAGVSRSPQMRAHSGPHPHPGPHPGHQAQAPQMPSSRQYNMYPLNPDGVEQLHRHQRSGTGSSKGKKPSGSNRMMPPPSRPIAQSNRNVDAARTASGHHRTRLPNPSRPSTGMTGVTQLPSDNALYERFQDAPAAATSGYGGLFMAANSNVSGNPGAVTRTGTKNGGQTGLRSSLFESTIM